MIKLRVFSFVLVAALMACGGGGGGGSSGEPSANAGPTAAQVAAITPAQLSAYTAANIQALGANIVYLSDPALQALNYVDGARVTTGSGQVGAITVAQIASFSPAQVRMIGAAGIGGSVSVARIDQLNSAAWEQLVKDPLQVAAITPAEIKTLSRGDHIVAMGGNIKYLSNSALQVLTYVDGANVTTGSGQVGAITVAQIASFSPAQVRMIGAAGIGGSVSYSKISQLNAGAWEQLVKDPLQVAAITPAEIKTLSRGDHIVAMGGNIKYLSDVALQALYFTDGARVTTGSGQVGAITVAQIALFTPAQVRMIGAAGIGGSVSVARIDQLNSAAWEQLVKDPLQVAAITPAEIKTLTRGDHFVAMGDNFKFLSDASLSALNVSQIGLITPAQKALLTTTQHAACGC